MVMTIVTMEDNRTKLDKEMSNLDHLREILGKSHRQTGQMSGILTHFDERLARLEETIQPVYRETGNLQSRQEAVVNFLEHLDYVIKFYTVASRVENRITGGPALTTLADYLSALNELKEAMDYFEKNNPESPELMNVSGLFERGANMVEREFQQLLRRASQPLTPLAIYALLERLENERQETRDTSKETPNIRKDSSKNKGKEKNTDQAAAATSAEQFPEKLRAELKELAQWLCENKNDDFVSVYASIRSEVLVRSLQALRDSQKSASGNFGTASVASGAAGGGGGGYDSPLTSRRQAGTGSTPGGGGGAAATSKRSTPRTLQSALRKKIADVVSGDSRQNTPTGAAAELRDENWVSDREVEGYILSLTALYKLMQNEFGLMASIIPYEHQRPIFSRLVLPALQSTAAAGEGLAGRVKRCVTRHDFSAPLNLFPILRHLVGQRHNFDLLFDGCTKEVTNKFHGLTIAITTTLNRALEEFVDHIKNHHADSKVPRDGTVHELTSNVMLLLVQLHEYIDILGRVISVPDMLTLENSPENRNRIAFAMYITRTLQSLGLCLQIKSDAYQDLILRSLFRLNNFHYILRTMRKSGLLAIVHLYQPDTERVYEDLILENRRNYQQSLERLLQALHAREDEYFEEMFHQFRRQSSAAASASAFAQQSVQLRDKDRQTLKDRFATFNKELDELHRVQTAYAIPDRDLRETIRADTRQLIFIPYQAMYSRYQHFPFTKNPEKYLKYTPEMVARALDELFDSSA